MSIDAARPGMASPGMAWRGRAWVHFWRDLCQLFHDAIHHITYKPR